MTNWVAWWFQPSPDHSVGPVEDQLAEMALRSLLNEDTPVDTGGSHIMKTIGQLRRHVDELERSLQDLPSK